MIVIHEKSKSFYNIFEYIEVLENILATFEYMYRYL